MATEKMVAGDEIAGGKWLLHTIFIDENNEFYYVIVGVWSI